MLTFSRFFGSILMSEKKNKKKTTSASANEQIDLVRDLKHMYTVDMKWTTKQLRLLKQHDACALELKQHNEHVGVWCRDHGVRIRWIPGDEVKNVESFINELNT